MLSSKPVQPQVMNKAFQTVHGFLSCSYPTRMSKRLTVSFLLRSTRQTLGQTLDLHGAMRHSEQKVERFVGTLLLLLVK